MVGVPFLIINHRYREKSLFYHKEILKMVFKEILKMVQSINNCNFDLYNYLTFP